jgi:hypothetical protein
LSFEVSQFKKVILESENFDEMLIDKKQLTLELEDKIEENNFLQEKLMNINVEVINIEFFY